MNELYLFVLGRDRALSFLELISYFLRKEISYDVVSFCNDAALVCLSNSLDAHKTLEDLGGTVKIAKKIPSLDSITITKNKIAYGITCLDNDANGVMEQLKKFFHKEKVKAVHRYGSLDRLPPKKSRQLDLELVVFQKNIFQVVAVSHPAFYKKRDAFRPVFDPLKGTSIRLSKILINLAQARRMILDPFCGIGTILQEALLMGYSVFGIDSDIRAAAKNIAWLGDAYLARAQLIEGDARRVASLVSHVEAVVTEPYLGPYVKKQLDRQEALVSVKKLEHLYLAFLTNIYQVLEGRVVLIIPRFRTSSGIVALDFEHILKKANFRICSLVSSIPFPLLYRYKESKIDRLIYVLEKGQ